MSRKVDGTMIDIHDSPNWKKAFRVNGPFQGNLRGVALSLCPDRLTPWSKKKINYPMWPIVFGQLNLPRKIRHQSANKSSACWNYPKLDTRRGA